MRCLRCRAPILLNPTSLTLSLPSLTDNPIPHSNKDPHSRPIIIPTQLYQHGPQQSPYYHPCPYPTTVSTTTQLLNQLSTNDYPPGMHLHCFSQQQVLLPALHFSKSQQQYFHTLPTLHHLTHPLTTPMLSPLCLVFYRYRSSFSDSSCQLA